MKTARLWMLAALPLALVACGGGDDAGNAAADSAGATDTAASTTAPSAAPHDSAMQGVGGAVTLNALNNSGITGQAQVMDHGQGQTMVTITLNGQGTGTHSGHIHQGTCENIGAVVAPLQDVTLANGTGTSTTTVAMPYPDVTDGQKVVSYHTGSGANPGLPATCGQISAQGGDTTGQGGQAM